MSLSIVTRWGALLVPYAWFDFATQFKDETGYVGPEYFRHYKSKWGAKIISPRDCGLVPDFLDLECATFKPALVHPAIRDFYEHTSLWAMHMSVTWNKWLQPLGAAYVWLVAKMIGQLEVPPDDIETDMISTVHMLDVDCDGRSDFRVWIRRRKDNDVMFYIGAFRDFISKVDGTESAYVVGAFPLPGCNIAVVLRMGNLPEGGFQMTSHVPYGTKSAKYLGATEAGTYLLIWPGKNRFSMVPGLGLEEDFRFSVVNAAADEPELRCEHKVFWLGMWACTLSYELKRSRKRAYVAPRPRVEQVAEASVA